MTEDHLGFYKHGNLPHLDIGGALQFITYLLADAAPKNQIHRNKQGFIDGDAYFLSMDSRLDRCTGKCLLQNHAVASIALAPVLNPAEDTHSAIAWVVMPNHIHLVIRQTPGWKLGKIVQRIKSLSAISINQHLNRTGQLWQHGYFDRQIRDLRHLQSTVEYIHDNPVNAGLVDMPDDWEFSSSRSFSFEKLEDLYK